MAQTMAAINEVAEEEELKVIEAPEYPKIETAFNRDKESYKVKLDEIRLKEYDLINTWIITEKIDGTNVRIHLDYKYGLRYCGRTNKANLDPDLVLWLQDNLPMYKVAKVFEPKLDVILFGEGYGGKIQRAKIPYRREPKFRLFDILITRSNGNSLWLEWEDVQSIAGTLGIECVPVLGEAKSLEEALTYLEEPSVVSMEDSNISRDLEGIVARTVPQLFTRTGKRLMWKLKRSDFDTINLESGEVILC